MKLRRKFFSNFLIIFLFNQVLIGPVESAEKIKIVYSIFSRTIEVDSLKQFAENGNATRNLRRLLKITNTPNEEIISILNKNFDIPITIASKLMYSEIGNVILSRLSKIIHTPKATDKRTGVLALKASIIQGINNDKEGINLISFFEAYPTKTVILNVNALSKVINKVESITELLQFFTDSPLDKLKEGSS